uniref:Uncharacterized protein n=1 Tax=Amphimedon queenslandica TaxID=400682 RepID=A0A1X7UEV9_AMPQE
LSSFDVVTESSFFSSFRAVESSTAAGVASFSSFTSVGSFLTVGVLLVDSSFGNVTLTEGCSSFVGAVMGGLAFCDLSCVGDSSTDFLSRSLLPYLLYLLIQVLFLDIGLPTLLDMRA